MNFEVQNEKIFFYLKNGFNAKVCKYESLNSGKYKLQTIRNENFNGSYC